MPLFVYTAMNESGQLVSGDLEAPAAADVIARLRRDRLFVTEVAPAARGARQGATRARRRSLGERLFPGLSSKDITALTRQLTSFLQGGFPLVRALEFIGRNAAKESLATLVAALADEVRGGGTLTVAVTRHKELFDKLYISMVSAGETSGKLETMFERLARMRESAEELRGEVKGALTYPAFMFLAMGGSLAILMTFVVPKFAAMFADMGSALPTPTLVLVHVAAVFERFWWMVLIAMAVAYGALRKYARTDAGRYRLDTLLLRLPVIGELFLKSATARFSQTLATLLGSGVDLVSSLSCSKDVSGSEVMARGVDACLKQVKEGKRLSDTMQATEAFPEELVEMIRVGEESGQVGSMLERAAETYSRDVRNVIKSLAKILEPLMILVMGVVIGLIVMAMLLPVFEMSTGGGG